jgi:hypothetical protein
MNKCELKSPFLSTIQIEEIFIEILQKVEPNLAKSLSFLVLK